MSIILQLKARHFAGTEFSQAGDCAMARAAREQLHAREVSVSTTYVYINNETMYKAHYSREQFDEDKRAAGSTGDPEAVVRGVRLIEE